MPVGGVIPLVLTAAGGDAYDAATMTIKYRVGIMPGPWPAGRDGAAFLWTLCDQLERSDGRIAGSAAIGYCNRRNARQSV